MNKGITGDKMLSHLDRVAGERLPITADIFLTNYCNNNCPYCTYRRWELGRDAYAMSLGEFQKYAVRLLRLGVKGFILTGGGEPTVCPDFDRIAEWLEGGGVRYGVNTNFNTLHLVKPDYLKVSLDGWDEESYERSRGGRAYQRTLKNIEAYAAWKKGNSPITSLPIPTDTPPLMPRSLSFSSIPSGLWSMSRTWPPGSPLTLPATTSPWTAILGSCTVTRAGPLLDTATGWRTM